MIEEMLSLCSKRMALFSPSQSLKGAQMIKAPSLSPWMQKDQEFMVCTSFSYLGNIPSLVSPPCPVCRLLSAMPYQCTECF